MAQRYQVQATSYTTVNGQEVSTGSPMMHTYRTRKDAELGIEMFKATAKVMGAQIMKDDAWYVLALRNGEWSEAQLLPC